MQPESTPHEPRPLSPEQEPTFSDLIRFLWGRRVRLTVLFLFFAGVSIVGLVIWRFFIARPVAEGTLTLTFRGMERHQYPSGKTFSIEDIRAPRVLARARDSAGVTPEKTDLRSLYVGIEITPVIPGEIQSRWRKQDRDGVKREEFFPSEFRLRVNPKGLTSDQKILFLGALVKAYQDEVKYEQAVALKRVSDFPKLSPSDLIKNFDTWDLPTLFRERETAFRQQLDALILESRDYRDSKFGISFRDLRSDLDTWDSIQLEALTAMIYRSRLVKDRDLMIKRLQHRTDELNVTLKQIEGEAKQSTNLVESLDRSKPLLAGPLTNREGAPLVDATALERLVRSDYVGPVVKRITELHKKAMEIEADRARCDLQLAILIKGDRLSGNIPAGFEELVGVATKDLAGIFTNFNALLDDYMTATITTLVTLKEGPRLTREGPSLSTLVAVFVLCAILLPFVIVFFERLFLRG